VESFFDGLNDQMAASLPGRTFRSWERRADYNPDDGPLLTYEGLLEIVHIHLVDVYSVSRHPAATKTRLEMWQESAAEHPPCLPASADDLVVMLAKRVDRVLSPRGIELSGMFYTSDELMALRAELASGNDHGGRVQVRFNPWDLGDVWVRNPVDGTYVKAAAIDTAMRGMTAYQWKVLKRAVRERFDRPEHLLSLAAGRNAIRDVVEEALQKPSRRRRVRAARFLSTPRTASNGQEERGDDGWLDAASDAQDSSLGPSGGDSPDSHDESTEPQRDSPEVTNEQPPLNIDADDIDVDDWDVTSS
jgi:putative transposase